MVVTVPDSITTWVAQAISVHPQYGIGVIDLPEVWIGTQAFILVIYQLTSVVLSL